MNTKIKITAAILVILSGIITTRSYAWLWVDPCSFDVNTVDGTIMEETLTIGNDGLEPLNYIIRTRQSATSGEATSAYGRGTSSSSIPAQYDFTTIAPNASYRQGRLIVRFAEDIKGQSITSERKIELLSSLGGANIENEFRIVPGLSVVQLPAGMTVEQALPMFNKANGILYAQPDYEIKLLSTISDDPRFDELWGMHNTGQSGGTIDADIDAPEAWDISTGSSEVIVALLDTGVDYTHIDLAANIWVNETELNGSPGVDDDDNGYIDDIRGWDFADDDSDPMDYHYHGTHCAGTIGGIGNNGEGVAGVCWNVKIMALKVFPNYGETGFISGAIKAIEYAVDNGAKVSSNSWGGGPYSQQ